MDIEQEFHKLNQREHQVLHMRYGLPPFTRKHTQTEIGLVVRNVKTGLPLTRQRIQAIEKRALEKLKETNGNYGN